MCQGPLGPKRCDRPCVNMHLFICICHWPGEHKITFCCSTCCQVANFPSMIVMIPLNKHTHIGYIKHPVKQAALVPGNKHSALLQDNMHSVAQVALVQDNKHRPMDLRALALRGAITAVTAAGAEPPIEEVCKPSGQVWEPLLMAGCVIAQEMRAALKVQSDLAAL